MYDLEIHLDDAPGSLSQMGSVLGKAGVSVEGGGAWTVGGKGIAHFLVEDGQRARVALEEVGLVVTACQPVVALRLRQELPGQLGLLTGRMGEKGVNIDVLYSDHNNRLILVTSDPDAAQKVAEAWEAEWFA